jgi:hypothetical protein
MLRSQYATDYTGKVGSCKYDSSKTLFKNVNMTEEDFVSNERIKELVSQ